MIDPFLIDPRKQLVRIKEGQLISGVCNGIAVRYFLPLSLIRLSFILLGMLSAGIGAIIVYYLLVVKLPLISLDLTFPGEAKSEETPATFADTARKTVREFLPIANGPEGDKWANLIILATTISVAVSIVASLLFGYK